MIITSSRTARRDALAARAAVAAGGLVGAFGVGARTGVWVDDEVDLATAILAVRAAEGCAFVALPDADATRVNELAALDHAVAIITDEVRAARLGGAGEPVVLAPDLVAVRLEPGGSVTGLGAPSPGVHFFTSGTDGRPKGVARSFRSLDLEDQVLGGHLGMGPGVAVLCAVPVTHGYGFTGGLFAPLAHGATAVLVRPRLASSLADALREHEPEIVIGVPAQYAVWAELRGSYDGPRPRVWLCGGAPLPAAVRARFEQAWGGVVAEQYGMTERGAVTVDLDGAGTLGTPYPGARVWIDGATGPGDVGEVVAHTPYGPTGYLGDDPTTGVGRFTPEGFRTGDQGWLDDAGRLHLVGRRAHQINVRGRKVDPVEVERAFWAVGGVRQVAVLGVDRAEGDQWVAAFVVCDAGVTDADLAAATDGLEPYRRPRRVIRLDALPQTPTGTDVAALRTIVSSRPGR